MADSVNTYTRFLKLVDHKGFDPVPCWPWLGAGKGNGYGHLTVGYENIPAHRRSYELFCGPVAAGHDVCHACDNRWCVNPDHLFVGTRQTNMSDCKAKGRTDGGRRKHLPEKTIQEIRRLANAGVSKKLISIKFDINYGTVTAICGGRSYGRVSQ